MKTSFKPLNSTSTLQAGSTFLIASVLVPLTLAGCGSPASAPPSGPAMSNNAPPPAIGTNNAQRPSLGLSGKQKLVLLSGAALLYYYYRKSKAATAKQYAGQQVQYYLSKNGAIYYRDPQHQAHFVTPPNKQEQVSAAEAQDYTQLKGYNGQNTGNGLDYYFNGANGAAGANAQ